MNVKRCNERKVYELHTKEKENELDVAMKDAELESTRELGNNILIKEANILSERQGKEKVRREWMFWAENISRDKKNLFKEFEREKKDRLRNSGQGRR